MSDPNYDRERSPRSNLMAHLKSSCMISYLRLIVSMGVSYTVYELQGFKI
jgi:hypothetical protein